MPSSVAEPLPCVCSFPNRECRRSGRPMIGRDWELCSGKCTAMRPCNEKESVARRKLWDERGGKPLDHPPSEESKVIAKECSLHAVIPIPAEGPGTEVKLVLESIGIKGDFGCGCQALLDQMNLWGTEGCKKHEKQIIDKLNRSYKKLTHRRKFKAVILAIVKITWVDPRDPGRSVFNRALANWEKKHGMGIRSDDSPREEVITPTEDSPNPE